MTDIAPSDVKWESKRASQQDIPGNWGDFKGEILRLKDTRHPFWKNRLDSPNTFVYSIPSHHHADWESRVIRRILERHGTTKDVVVHLFATPGSRNEDYGFWIVDEVKHNVRPKVSELWLKRLLDQDEYTVITATSRKRSMTARIDGYRSKNEDRHSDLLARKFPPDKWIVCHEPETVLDLHEPTVVDGRMRTAAEMVNSYTCDFVVASKDGARRLCVESKPCVEHVTDTAILKCRRLRDSTLTRVCFLVGNGDNSKWLDIGPIGEKDTHTWYDTFEAFYEAVIV